MLRNKLLVIFLILGLLSLSYAWYNSPKVTVYSPTDNSQYTVGEDIVVQVETDFGMKWISIYVSCSEEYWVKLAQTYFPKDENEEYTKTTYETTINTDGWTPGECYLQISPSDVEGKTYGYYVPMVLTESDETIEGPVVVYRNAMDSVYPGKNTYISLSVFPQEDFTGIIIREKIPEGTNYFGMGGVLGDAIIDLDYVDGEKALKILLKSSEAVESYSISYIVTVNEDLQPGQIIPLTGDWVILDDTGEIMGKDHMTIAGEDAFPIPDCPIPDEVLLDYIDKWANMQLSFIEAENDEIMQQIIEVWKSC